MALSNRPIGLGQTRAEGITNVAAGAAGNLLSPGDFKKNLLVSAPSIAGGVLTAGGSSSIAAAAWGAMAVPIIGAAVAGVTIGLMMLFNRKGPKQKVATTQIVDQVEPLLQKNLDGYLNGPRNRAAQAQAIQNFEAGWRFVVEQCQIPEMGSPGQRCVSERQRGGQWDWFRLYLDPIADDPDVKEDPAAAGAFDVVADSIAGGAGKLGSGGLLLGAGLLAAALLL